MVEVNNQQQDTSLLPQTSIAGLDINVTLHWILNRSQGVVYHSYAIKETDASLLEGLKDKGVKAVMRITTWKDNKDIATKTSS